MKEEKVIKYKVRHLYTWEQLSNRIKVNNRESLVLKFSQWMTSETLVFKTAESGEISFCSVVQPYLTVCDPVDGSTQDFPILYCLLEFVRTHVH